MRPDRWWFIMVQLFFLFSLTMCSAISRSSRIRIYASCIINIGFLVVAFKAKPFKFETNNKVDLCLKCTLLVFLILTTSFKEKDFADNDGDSREMFAWMIIVAICLAMLFGLFEITIWAVNCLRSPTKDDRHTLNLALQFRDVSIMLALIPHHDLMNMVRSLGEADLMRLRHSISSVVSIFFCKQPSKNLFRQRIMPGIPFERWQPVVTMLDVLEACTKDKLNFQTKQSAEHRACMLMLVSDLNAHLLKPRDVSCPVAPDLSTESASSGSRSGGSGLTPVKSLSLGKERTVKALKHVHLRIQAKNRAHNLADLIGLPHDSSMTFEDFKDSVSRFSEMPEQYLLKAFEFLDLSNDARLTHSEFVTTVKGAVPLFDGKQSARLFDVFGSLNLSALPEASHATTELPPSNSKLVHSRANSQLGEDSHDNLKCGLQQLSHRSSNSHEQLSDMRAVSQFSLRLKALSEVGATIDIDVGSDHIDACVPDENEDYLREI